MAYPHLIPTQEELFNVVQFFGDTEDADYEYVRRNVPAEEAAKAMKHYTSSVAAKLGMVKRVIITDGGDDTCAEWIYGKGITFPPPPGTASQPEE